MSSSNNRHSESGIIVQSNQLVEARYSISLMEQRILLAMMAGIRKNDEDFAEIEINLGDFAKTLGITGKRFYAEAKKATKQLLSRPLIIDEPEGELQVNWISSARYVDGKGIVRLRFDPSLKTHLLQLQREFTILQSAAICLKSQYSIRIYMLLKQYERVGRRKMSVADLRHKLGIADDEYKAYYSFKRRTILVAQKEFDTSGRSDITFEFEEQKNGGGKQITDIVFYIKRREGRSQLEIPQQYLGELPVLAALKQYGVSSGKSRELIDLHGIDPIEDAIRLYESRIKEGVVKNLDGGYLLKLIAEGAGIITPIEKNISAEQRANKQTEAFVEEQKRTKKIEEELQISAYHEECLKAYHKLSVSRQVEVLDSLAVKATLPIMRKRVRENGLKSIDTPYIKAIFNRLMGKIADISEAA